MITTQEEEGKYLIIRLNHDDNNKSNYYDTVYLVLLLIFPMPSYMPHGESLVYHVSLFRLAHLKVKDEVMKYNNLPRRLLRLVHQVDSNSNVNLNKIPQIVLLIFLQLRCKWILKKYQVENDITDLEWMVKKYWVNNDIKKYQVDNNTSIHYSPSGFRDKVGNTKMELILNTTDTKLQWILKKYQVNNDHTSETIFDDNAPLLQLVI